ncbi:hypothetical protein SAMN04487977_103354 [Treponema bryantii]|uniref:Uncharacterized protein n=2 Tax=Treponema bryantii TaxID=163 RepID=A0A1H9F149_9SPIR|nr:hypothetical protein SAMN04487977_103354 [Treponema bryantii]
MWYNMTMNIKKFLDKPFRLMALIGSIYLITMILMNVFTDFFYELSVMPFSRTVSYSAEGVALVLCVLSFFFYTHHSIYYIALETLAFSYLYTGRVYTALFITAILFFLLMTENRLASKVRLSVYLALEVAKMIFVIPYGVRSFFEYIGITLFSLATIGCINLLFRHAYEKKDSGEINLDDYKFTDRQIDCIKETVVNNTTIKALAITHNVSESAIKKDLAHIYSVLGIDGKADLKALFIGYKFD